MSTLISLKLFLRQNAVEMDGVRGLVGVLTRIQLHTGVISYAVAQVEQA